MKLRNLTLLVLSLSALSFLGFRTFQEAPTHQLMTKAAKAYVESLNEEQKAKSVLDYDAKSRVDWHFIPKKSRKGLPLREMKPEQKKLALNLLRSALSSSGYEKSQNIMSLEGVLLGLEKGRGAERDPSKYYVTIFGDPSGKDQWGLSYEGHHLSLNFVVNDEKVVSSTPAFFASNPAIVKKEVAGVKVGTRVIKEEETLAFELVNSLNKAQQAEAIIAKKAIKEIRGAGSPQPVKEKPVGIQYTSLEDSQKQLLHKLMETYVSNMPADIAKKERDRLVKAGLDTIHFAWAGATKPGIGHYYRIEGPTFQIEFVNTQPDSLGNVANHIHCVWRNPDGDFAIESKP